MLVKLDHFPGDQGEHKKYLSCHHLDTQYRYPNFTSQPAQVEISDIRFLLNPLLMGGRVHAVTYDASFLGYGRQILTVIAISVV